MSFAGLAPHIAVNEQVGNRMKIDLLGFHEVRKCYMYASIHILSNEMNMYSLFDAMYTVFKLWFQLHFCYVSLIRSSG